MARTITFPGSSNVKTATLNEDGTTDVVFVNGGKATYKNVTPAMFDEWEKAESGGRWFHNKVRSKPTDFPMIAQAKDGEHTPVEGVPAVPPPLPPAPAAHEHAAAPHAHQHADAGAALKLANAKIAELQSSLERERGRADKAEQEVERLAVAIQHAKKAAERSGGAARFRPWRRG